MNRRRVPYSTMKSSMGGCAGAGISEAFDLVFRWMRGDVDL